MRLDDFIVLGRTVPEDSKRYGRRVCMAGYSRELGGLVRVYPLTIDNPLRSRHRAALELTRNDGDSRKESFKLVDAVDGIVNVSCKPVIDTSVVFNVADDLCHRSIAELNRNKLSLGLVGVVGTPRVLFVTRREINDPNQLDLFDGFAEDICRAGFVLGADHRQVPYLEFRDIEGWHCLQLREWGCFERMRKAGVDALATSLKFNDHCDYVALVGNMVHRRNTWLVIQIFKRPKTAQLPLFGDMRR